MRQVIMQFEPTGRNLERSIRNLLEFLTNKDGQDFSFPSLTEIMQIKHPDWTYHRGFSESLPVDEIMDAHAVIWFPAPMEKGQDFFKKLSEDGFKGKKILLHTGRISKDTDMGEIFGKYADHKFGMDCDTKTIYHTLT